MISLVNLKVNPGSTLKLTQNCRLEITHCCLCLVNRVLYCYKSQNTCMTMPSESYILTAYNNVVSFSTLFQHNLVAVFVPYMTLVSLNYCTKLLLRNSDVYRVQSMYHRVVCSCMHLLRYCITSSCIVSKVINRVSNDLTLQRSPSK